MIGYITHIAMVCCFTDNVSFGNFNVYVLILSHLYSTHFIEFVNGWMKLNITVIMK